MPNLVDVNFDDATGYVGDGSDGVYYTVREHPDGFYVSAVVDSGTGHFVHGLFHDNGPFGSEEEAMDHAQVEAGHWCCTNGVELTPPDSAPGSLLDLACPGRDAEPGAPHVFEKDECIFCKTGRRRP